MLFFHRTPLLLAGFLFNIWQSGRRLEPALARLVKILDIDSCKKIVKGYNKAGAAIMLNPQMS